MSWKPSEEGICKKEWSVVSNAAAKLREMSMEKLT